MNRRSKFGFKKRWNKYIIVLILFLGMGFGYAYLNSNLNISGTSQISGNRWDIHWENPVVSEGSVTNTLPSLDTNRTIASYNVTLSNPGDFYEFTIDAVNAGTINAKISVISLNIINNQTTIDTLPNYLNYSVTYANGGDINEGDTLNANTTKKYKVRVEFKRDISVSDLPSNSETFTFSTSITYVQGNSTPAGECTFDGEMIKGAEYVNGIYKYHYKQSAGDISWYSFNGWNDIPDDGWGVVLAEADPYNIGVSSIKNISEAPCKYINGKPVVSYSNMFFMKDIESIDVSSWDTSEVKYFTGMFVPASPSDNVSYAIRINGLNHMNLSNAVTTVNMFSNVQQPLSFDINELADWDVSKVTNMDFMFDCEVGFEFFEQNGYLHDKYGNDAFCIQENISYSALNSWDIHNVVTFEYIFDNAYDFYDPFTHYSHIRTVNYFNREFPSWSGGHWDEYGSFIRN